MPTTQKDESAESQDQGAVVGDSQRQLSCGAEAAGTGTASRKGWHDDPFCVVPRLLGEWPAKMAEGRKYTVRNKQGAGSYPKLVQYFRSGGRRGQCTDTVPHKMPGRDRPSACVCKPKWYLVGCGILGAGAGTRLRSSLVREGIQ